MKRQSLTHQNPQKSTRQVSHTQKPCKFYAAADGCKLGDKCPYIHVEQLEPAKVRSYRSKRFLAMEQKKRAASSSTPENAIKPFLDTSVDSIERVPVAPNKHAENLSQSGKYRAANKENTPKTLNKQHKKVSSSDSPAKKSPRVSKKASSPMPASKKPLQPKKVETKKGMQQQETPATTVEIHRDEDEEINVTPTSPAGASESETSSTIAADPAVEDISSPYDYPLAGEETSRSPSQEGYKQHAYAHPQPHYEYHHMMYYAAPPVPAYYAPPGAYYAAPQAADAYTGAMIAPHMYAAPHPSYYYPPQATSAYGAPQMAYHYR